jgi:hypothetical protein
VDVRASSLALSVTNPETMQGSTDHGIVPYTEKVLAEVGEIGAKKSSIFGF